MSRMKDISLVDWLISGYPNSEFHHPSNAWVVQGAGRRLGEEGGCRFWVQMSSLASNPAGSHPALTTLRPWYHKKGGQLCSLGPHPHRLGIFCLTHYEVRFFCPLSGHREYLPYLLLFIFFNKTRLRTSSIALHLAFHFKTSDCRAHKRRFIASFPSWDTLPEGTGTSHGLYVIITNKWQSSLLVGECTCHLSWDVGFHLESPGSEVWGSLEHSFFPVLSFQIHFQWRRYEKWLVLWRRILGKWKASSFVVSFFCS